MFPSFSFDDAIQTITEESNQSDSITLGRVFKIDFEGNKATVVMENGKPVEATTIQEKVQRYVQLLLRTELEKFNVYKDTEFGMTYFKYRGNRLLPKGFINSELKREIEEKITQLSVVDSISNFNAKMNDSTLEIDFTINLVDGTSISTSEVI